MSATISRYLMHLDPLTEVTVQGSSEGRNLGDTPSVDPDATLRDLDFKRVIKLGERKGELVAQLSRDCEVCNNAACTSTDWSLQFMLSLGIMDYSFLLGIHKMADGEVIEACTDQYVLTLAMKL